MEEVDAVMEFVNMLLSMDKITQSDIGICSPYKLQCKIIKQHCEKSNRKEIVIGPAEVFQGQERPVMIVSTVRSGRSSALGDFLQNAQVRFIGHSLHTIPNDNHIFVSFYHQRFNVMLTRAKNLLIVVGNPHLLTKNSNWRAFIEYCFRHRCLIQGAKCYYKPQKPQN